MAFADGDIAPMPKVLEHRARRTVAFVILVILGAGILAGWFAREWTQSVIRAPEQHAVAGTVSTIDATGLCVKPDDINTQPTCAATIALAPQPFHTAIGTRVRGEYIVAPKGDNAPGVFLWVTLVPTS